VVVLVTSLAQKHVLLLAVGVRGLHITLLAYLFCKIRNTPSYRIIANCLKDRSLSEPKGNFVSWYHLRGAINQILTLVKFLATTIIIFSYIELHWIVVFRRLETKERFVKLTLRNTHVEWLLNLNLVQVESHRLISLKSAGLRLQVVPEAHGKQFWIASVYLIESPILSEQLIMVLNLLLSNPGV
jgi:hypothetical protein